MDFNLLSIKILCIVACNDKPDFFLNRPLRAFHSRSQKSHKLISETFDLIHLARDRMLCFKFSYLRDKMMDSPCNQSFLMFFLVKYRGV